MTNKLAENIRTFRKARSLTQEQLAEVLGVTTGAVYKWEARLSQPELGMLMELADFFDTSVDVLLGYEMKDNRLEATVARLKRCRWEKDRMGLAEAEKALKKYPNAFEVVYNSAALYRVFGMEGKEPQLLHRALELSECARLLLPQNTDPKISESTLSGEMAEILLSLGDHEQAVRLLKENNAGGIYDDQIGLTLAADCKRPEEALPYLSSALLRSTASVIRIIMGYVNVYLARADYPSAQAILRWGVRVLTGLQEDEKPSFLNKINATLLTCLAFAQLKAGDAEAARASLLEARTAAERFDAAPDHRAGALRFVRDDEEAGVYDDLGTSGMQSIQRAVEQMESPELLTLWKELRCHA